MRSKLNSEDVSRKTPAAMMQSLEPRRLMSLSGAVEFPVPPAPPAAPHIHSFGFEDHFADVPPLPAVFGLPAQPPSPQQIGELEAQLASAIARGVAINAFPPTGATPTPVYSDPTDHSLSAMYGSLETSTLAAIDNADVATGTLSVTQPVLTKPADLTPFTALPALATDATRALAVSSNPIAADAVNTPVVMVPPGIAVFPRPVELPAAAETPLHASLESQLQAISLEASEAISRLGRDIAISLVHLEDDLLDAGGPDMQQIAGWRGGGLVAGAMVAAVYLHSRRKDQDAPQASPFSDHPVRVEFPEPRP